MIPCKKCGSNQAQIHAHGSGWYRIECANCGHSTRNHNLYIDALWDWGYCFVEQDEVEKYKNHSQAINTQ